MRVAAVDWSGRATGAGRHIWTAVAEDGRLLSLESGRDQKATVEHLLDLAAAGPALVAGLDFGFSLPLWFLDREGYGRGMDVPEEVCERWLRECPPPFWGRRGRPRGGEPQHRATEGATLPRAKSIFQVGGSGAVGTGSLRGFPALRRLRAGGFSIWPFDPPRFPVALEIFPRLLTGPVIKSRREARQAYLARHGWPAHAAISEDAFDAAVSALVMDLHRDQLARLPALSDPVARREGRIWSPAADAQKPGGHR